MDLEAFKIKKNKLMAWGEQYKLDYTGSDPKVGRVSFADYSLGIKLDIYTSKNTVCIMRERQQPVYKKKQSMEMIEQIMEAPYELI